MENVTKWRLKRPVIALVLLTCVLPVLCQAQPPKRPNIVVILADDLGYGDLASYGSDRNQTPYIDQLAEKGLRFTDYHANGPMCTPTRVALMTGQYQNRFGAELESALDGASVDGHGGLPTSVYTMAEALRDLGYETGMYGKWHMGLTHPFVPTQHGFNDFRGILDSEADHFTHIGRWGRYDWWHNDTLKHEDGYSVDLVTDHSVDFINRHKDEPFFLYVSHLAIHFPWQGPDDPAYRVAGNDYSDDKWGIIPDHDRVDTHIKTMVEALDTGVGKIMKALESNGLTENTIVIFTSDNGGYVEYKLAADFNNISSNGVYRGQKMDVYEGGHRVPFIISWPGTIPEGQVRDDLIMTMDMYPSFVKLAGGKIPERLDGKDISRVWTQGRKVGKRAVFWKMKQKRAMRLGDWKLVSLNNKAPELYNLSADPGETTDISSGQPRRTKKMIHRLTKWEREVTANWKK